MLSSYETPKDLGYEWLVTEAGGDDDLLELLIIKETLMEERLVEREAMGCFPAHASDDVIREIGDAITSRMAELGFFGYREAG